ncbi:MAG: Zn-dependent hydrolase [Rhodococcus sp. (in: high G+C Gram-positive bacteria)]|nr:Zn-dependent hydrolase [Rhodococcus sp. (in: high G+C Gram-positive bacteria)]
MTETTLDPRTGAGSRSIAGTARSTPGPVTIDPVRFDSHIGRFAELTEDASAPGVTRLAFTPLERRAHEVFGDHMRAAGLTVWTDAAGNTIAERAGTVPSLPAIGTGSHLDSVPEAGRYDGIAGVVAAMEIAHTLAENDVRHRHPIRFVAFANEEGARFGQACIGSRLIAGLTTRADLDHLADDDGVTVAQAMTSVGIDPDAATGARWKAEEWAAFLELHIEQGAVLASLDIPIGVVDLISGSTRLQITLRGRASHTGGTPMHLRVDALAAAAEIVLRAEKLASDSRHRGTRITVGKLTVEPGSITTIPGLVTLAVDVRDVDAARQRQTASELIGDARTISSARGVGIDVDLLADASPVVLPRRIRDSIVSAAVSIGIDYRVMPSGASHDSQMVNRVCPVGMVFVPSQNHGVSHSPDEFSTATDLARGTEVLAAAILAVDASLDADHDTARKDIGHE